MCCKLITWFQSETTISVKVTFLIQFPGNVQRGMVEFPQQSNMNKGNT